MSKIDYLIFLLNIFIFQSMIWVLKWRKTVRDTKIVINFILNLYYSWEQYEALSWWRADYNCVLASSFSSFWFLVLVFQEHLPQLRNVNLFCFLLWSVVSGHRIWNPRGCLRCSLYVFSHFLHHHSTFLSSNRARDSSWSGSESASVRIKMKID